MKNQEKRDLTLHKEIKKETNAYEALCNKKFKYTSFSDMKCKLTQEIKSYDKDERDRIYECYKNYIEKTNVFVSSIIPVLASFMIGVFTMALTIQKGYDIMLWVAFGLTLVALSFFMIRMAHDSARGTNEKRFYQMVIEIIESIEKNESESKNSTSTDEEVASLN